MTLRTDYTNDTDSTDTHPAADNDTNMAVNTHDTAIAGNTAAIAALQADAGVGSSVRKGPAGHWIYPYDINVVPTTGALGNRNLRIFRIQMAQAFDAAAFEVTVAGTAGAAARIVVYNVGTDGMPTSVAVKSTTADVTTLGVKTITFTAIPAGVYWLGLISTADITVRIVTVPTSQFVSMSTVIPTLTAGFNCWQQFLTSYNADSLVPDPWGPPYPRDANTTNQNSAPVMLVRLAAAA